MKPAWDKLMDTYATGGASSGLVADVDCTVEESLCEKQGIEGYPTVKYGDPAALQDYQGGREYEELLEFANSNLGPECGLGENLINCSEEQKTEINSIQELSNDKISEMLTERHERNKQIEAEFNKAVEALEKQYQKAIDNKETQVADLKAQTPRTSVLKMVGKQRGLPAAELTDEPNVDGEGDGDFGDDEDFGDDDGEEDSGEDDIPSDEVPEDDL